MIAKLLLSAFISISFRTAKITPNPSDYEIKGGITSKKYLKSLYGKLERENGEMYKGIKLNTHETYVDFRANDVFYYIFDGLSAELYIDESRGIHEQSIYKNMLGVNLLEEEYKIRMTNRWEKWKYEGVLVGVLIKLKNTKLQYDTNFDSLHIFQLELGKAYYINKFYIKPLYKLYKSERSETFQYKTEIGYIF